MRAHEVVLGWVEHEIAEGRILIGQRLPAERTIADQLRVSRTSVREAIRVLEAMGMVRSGVGSGPEAGTLLIADPSAPFTAAMRLHFATSHLPVDDIVQTRTLLESWAVEHADSSSPFLKSAALLLDAMDEPGLETECFLQLDAEFHVALSQAAGNVLISTMMGALRDSIEHYTLDMIGNLPDWSAMAMRLRAEHRQIYDVVLSGDPVEASALVAAHIEGYYREAGFPSYQKSAAELARPRP
ncbi:FadR/GntR family transcriptional regulator [Crystallibacter degradans]|uniref:FadR/GntR family transcriptional regulator n=1 Tax=Crystallibacter degradans TaxID=2726743 RepID=UPI00147519BB|nr:FCD domain-containing protein [Arthrobacter sp. SF27]NMR30648.1 FadR family transcriptional regulator [Arthrobacter sp. SF27]